MSEKSSKLAELNAKRKIKTEILVYLIELVLAFWFTELIKARHTLRATPNVYVVIIYTIFNTEYSST